MTTITDYLKLAAIGLHVGAAGAIVLQGVTLAGLRQIQAAKQAVWRGLRLLAAVVVLEAAVFSYARLIEPNWIVVRYLHIRHEALAEALGSTRLVHLTDLHTERLGWRERRLVQLANREQPEWIVITGDFVNDAQGWPAALEVIRQLQAARGIVAVPGNTDNHFLTPRQFDEDLQAIGVKVLRNAAVPLGATGAWLVGVDDPVNRQDRLKLALRGVPGSGTSAQPPVILLAHSPDIMPDAVAAEIPLVLVGHTHGGQIGIPWLIRFSSYANRGRYVLGGLYHDGPTQLYLNRGIGSKVMPYRLLAPPEITVISFE